MIHCRVRSWPRFTSFQMTIANREQLPIIHWFAGISIAALANTTAIYSFHNASINGENFGCTPISSKSPAPPQMSPSFERGP